MSVSFIDSVTRALDSLFPKRRVAPAARLFECLRRSPLSVIDVGGAMGIDARWLALPMDCLRFMTFEPDNRSTKGAGRADSSNDILIPMAVSDTSGERTLYLTKGPFASSLYPVNQSTIQAFAVRPWYEPAGEIDLAVDTLTSCLERWPDFSPDFIKIDVEGADLDVLKGGRASLDPVFGIQIEVPFIVRNCGAPLQWEIDMWLRQNGFTLHLLEREHWIRANGAYGALSQPQLAWADAIYFRDREWVLRRLDLAKGPEEAESVLVRVVAALLVYNAHDYAVELVTASSDAGLVSPATASELSSWIRGSLLSQFSFTLRGVLAMCIAIAVASPLALAGSRGRRAAGHLIALQAAPLFGSLSRAARRSGLKGSCIPDV
jgi:FkbM family methyltransferase